MVIVHKEFDEKICAIARALAKGVYCFMIVVSFIWPSCMRSHFLRDLAKSILYWFNRNRLLTMSVAIDERDKHCCICYGNAIFLLTIDRRPTAALLLRSGKSFFSSSDDFWELINDDSSGFKTPQAQITVPDNVGSRIITW